MNNIKAFLPKICQESFEKCFSFIKKDSKKEEYAMVNMKAPDNEIEENEIFNDWPTEGSIYKTPKNETPIDVPITTVKKPVLVGNVDEESLIKKKDTSKVDTYDEMFDDFDKPTFDQKLKISNNNFAKSNKPAVLSNPFGKTEKTTTKELKLEEEPNHNTDGWGDDDLDIKL